MPEGPETVGVRCDTCGGGVRPHCVLQEHVDTGESEDGSIWEYRTHQIVKCQGCTTVRFRQYRQSSEERDPETGDPDILDLRVFPEQPSQKWATKDSTQFPTDVAKMYRETVQCFNVGANTLAGGGLRATVEAICKDRGVKGKNLVVRIDGLVQKGVLAQAQADLLHEERYIGNDALHEMQTPSDQDVRDGLLIVEGLLHTLYVLPKHGERLKKKRTGGSATGKASR